MVDDLVSIITPAYNAEEHIGETIESVLAQTDKNWEMIIVNDCSKDNTLKIANEYAALDNRIKVINLEKNGGAANAWNVAFNCMKGRYLSFLDSDDLWIETKLEEQINFMQENNYAFTYASYDWIDSNSKSLHKIIKIPKIMSYKAMLKNSNIGLLTVMIDRNQINIKPIPCVNMAWDFLLWAKILKQGVIAHGYDNIIAHYRILSNSASRNKKKAALGLWNIYKNYLCIPFFKRCYYFMWYALNSIKRYYLD